MNRDRSYLMDAKQAHRLVAQQFPQWKHLAARPVALGGHDNRPSIWATTGCYAFQALRNMLHKSIKNNSGCRNCGPYSRCRSLSRSALGNPRKNIPGNGRFTAIWKEKLQRLLRCTTVKKSPQRSEAF